MGDSEDASAADHERARKHVQELRRFYINVVVYLVVNLGLFIIDTADGGGWWFFWPLLIWGAFLVIDGVAMFLRRGPLGPDWEERKVRRLIEQERSRKPSRSPQPQSP